VHYGDAELGLFIDNDGRGDTGAHSRSPGGGNGLPGMRERATSLGGTLRAGPTARGGFLVEAALPTSGDLARENR
jgi:signal transduction histidine kinase